MLRAFLLIVGLWTSLPAALAGETQVTIGGFGIVAGAGGIGAEVHRGQPPRQNQRQVENKPLSVSRFSGPSMNADQPYWCWRNGVQSRSAYPCTRPDIVLSSFVFSRPTYIRHACDPAYYRSFRSIRNGETPIFEGC